MHCVLQPNHVWHQQLPVTGASTESNVVAKTCGECVVAVVAVVLVVLNVLEAYIFKVTWTVMRNKRKKAPASGCTCNKVFKKKVLSLQCETCGRWCHQSCTHLANFSMEELSKLDRFDCSACK